MAGRNNQARKQESKQAISPENNKVLILRKNKNVDLHIHALEEI